MILNSQIVLHQWGGKDIWQEMYRQEIYRREIKRREIGKRRRQKDGGKKLAGKKWRGREIFFGGICFLAVKGNLPLYATLSLVFLFLYSLSQSISLSLNFYPLSLNFYSLSLSLSSQVWSTIMFGHRRMSVSGNAIMSVSLCNAKLL